MVFWGEHLFFDAKNIDESKLTVEKITIKVMNHRALLRDSLIGLCEIDMYWLYGQDDHKMMHRWLALFSPEGEDYDKLKGYLKISACLLHEDDRSVDLTVKD